MPEIQVSSSGSPAGAVNSGMLPPRSATGLTSLGFALGAMIVRVFLTDALEPSAAGASAEALPTALPPSTLPASDSAPVALGRMALLGSPVALAEASAALRSDSALAIDTFAAAGVPLIAGA